MMLFAMRWAAMHSAKHASKKEFPEGRQFDPDDFASPKAGEPLVALPAAFFYSESKINFIQFAKLLPDMTNTRGLRA